jgi:hypothetical protein
MQRRTRQASFNQENFAENAQSSTIALRRTQGKNEEKVGLFGCCLWFGCGLPGGVACAQPPANCCQASSLLILAYKPAMVL